MVPCGLGARDTLRTEMGYPLHGQDIGLDVTPVQARLGWSVGWDKPAFWAARSCAPSASAAPTSPCARLVAQGRGIARPQMSVKLTRTSRSATSPPAPSRRPCARASPLALVNSQVQLGAEVLVDVRGRAETFLVTKPPFVETDVR